METAQQRIGRAYPVTGGNIFFDINTGMVIGCDKTVTEARVPDEIDGVRVKGIKGYAFNYCDELVKVTIPSSVTDMGSWSFWGRNSLKNIYVAGENEKFCDIDGVLYSKNGKILVFYPASHGKSYDIPAGTTDLGKGAFYNCTELESVRIPESVVNIHGSFYGCTSLTSVKLPGSLQMIGDGSFGNCKSLVSINIPFNVKQIFGNAFCGCENLKSIRVNSDNVSYCDVDGVLYTRDKTKLVIYPAAHGDVYEVPEMVNTIGDWAFAKSHMLRIVLLNNSVTTIGEWAFGDCDSITSLSLPDSVITIGKRAFWHCEKLERIMLSHSIELIDDYTFAACSSLEGITIPEGVKSIGREAFKHCYALKDIIFPDTLNNIVERAFESCTALSAVTIPSSVKYMGANVFKGCWELYTVYCLCHSAADDPTLYPEGTEFIYTGEEEEQDKDKVVYPVKGGNAYFRKSSATFIDCDLYVTEAKLPDKVEGIEVKAIGENAFLNCSALTNVILPSTITEIGANAFNGCTALKSLKIPEGVKSIGSKAFDSCLDMQSIDLPESLESIEGYIFGNCRSLKQINIPMGNVHYTSEDGVLYSRDRSVIICYPAGKTEESYVIEPTVRSIYENAFDEARSLKNIVLPQKLQSICEGAFSHCSGLKSVIIPDGVKFIGNFAFEDCSNLNDIDIPSSVKKFDDFVFDGCTNMNIVYCEQGSFADNKELYPTGNVVCVYIH